MRIRSAFPRVRTCDARPAAGARLEKQANCKIGGLPRVTPQLAIKTAEIYICVFAFDGGRAFNETPALTDFDSRRRLRQPEGHADDIYGAAFSQDPRRAFSCDWNGGIGVWDLEVS